MGHHVPSQGGARLPTGAARHSRAVEGQHQLRLTVAFFVESAQDIEHKVLHVHAEVKPVVRPVVVTFDSGLGH